MSKMIEVPFDVIKVAIRQSVVLKRWYKRYLQKNKPAVVIEPDLELEEESEVEQTDIRQLKRNELVKLASSLGVEKANNKSNEDLYIEIDLIQGEDNADNDENGG